MLSGKMVLIFEPLLKNSAIVTIVFSLITFSVSSDERVGNGAIYSLGLDAKFYSEEHYTQDTRHDNFAYGATDSITSFSKVVKEPSQAASVSNKEFDTFDIISIYFEPNSTKVAEAFNEELAKISSYLVSHRDKAVQIVGYTDSVGEHQYNLILSKKRAVAIENFFLSKGVFSKQISTLGRGYSSLAMNTPDSMSRRVDITMHFVNYD